MIKAVLFDLDDTLLGNDVDTFVPRYFKLLGAYVAELLPVEEFIQALLACTEITIQNGDTTRTNFEVFWEAFTARTGLATAVAEPFFARFYEEVFPQLQAVTVVRPLARPLVQHCFDVGLKVVIATNPLFPRAAIEQRLAWAGVPVTEFDYALVTTMENMHATKPHSIYYTEILQCIGCDPDKALMVGDSWQNDIAPAAALGMHTFWMSPTAEPPP
ncbi:MAG TPA: HAD family hydrolase, partial [Chloroflexota bacterium]|nr:HAD family hydrolase [Chloroflexota bacterium]